MPDLEIGAADGGSHRLRAYLAEPDGQGPFPAVLVLHEMFGLTDAVRGVADRFAAAGYLTLAPDLLSDGAGRGFARVVGGIVGGQGRTPADVLHAKNWLLGRPESSGRIGVFGMSMGASVALRTLDLGWDAASVAYPVQLFRLEKALTTQTPLLVSLGGTDPTALGAQRRFESALLERGIQHEVTVHPGAGHSYLNESFEAVRPLRPLLAAAHQGPDAKAASETLRQTEEFFAHHLR